MAHQFVLGRSDEGEQIQTGHGHCPECGACFIGGMAQDRHNCAARPVDKEVLRVMFDEMRSTAEKSRLLHRAPEGFHEIAGVHA